MIMNFWESRALCRIIGYTGIAYSGPTLASLISNITPAFTFILAIIFRFSSSSSLFMLLSITVLFFFWTQYELP